MATVVEVNDEVHPHRHNGRFVVVSFRSSRSAVPRQPGSSKGEKTGIPDFLNSGDPSLPSKLPTGRRAPRLTSGLLCLYLAALSGSRLHMLPKIFFVCDAYAVAWRVL
jgi:hypothetical protein